MERGINSPGGSREPSMRSRSFTGAAHAPLGTSSSTAQGDAKLLLVDFRSGEAVRKHPEVAPLLSQGWRIKSAVPRLVEAKGTKLLVVLTPPSVRWAETNLA